MFPDTSSKEPLSERVNYFLILSLRFTFLFTVVYGGCDLLASNYGASNSPRTRIDDIIPFLPKFSIFYLSITPLFILSPFFLSLKEMKYLESLLQLNLLIAGLFFVFMPTDIKTNFLHDQNFDPVFKIADTINLTNNAFPSLHVAFTITLLFTYLRKSNLISSVLIVCWSILIVLSTLFTHQHTLVDVIGGILLSLICFQVRRLMRLRYNSKLMLVSEN